ncbi:MAG: heme-degrading domain-containing protein [Spirochaetia bacterium]|jgi:uncharacterized protein (UPF0303 family)|nr:heme-degrading domain-containing protein [Spirochaetia bacterium]
MNDQLQQLLEQEATLQFASFNEDDAWQLGCLFVDKARKDKLGITIDIATKDKVLFHYSCKGTNPDNDHWVSRKKAAVNRFGHSSWYLGLRLKDQKTGLEERYYVSEREFAVHGGCFPIIVRDTGIIGTVTVSGLAQQDDHAVVVEVLSQYLQQKAGSKA